MDSPGDGWENELVRASSAYVGSFCSFMQAISHLTDRLRLQPTWEGGQIDSMNVSQPSSQGDGGQAFVRFEQGGAMSGIMGRSAVPLAIYGTAKRIAGQRSIWIGAMGMAAAASLSAALAATATELPMSDQTTGAALRRKADEGDETDPTSSAGASLGDLLLDKDAVNLEEKLPAACISVAKGISSGGIIEPKTKVRFPVLLCDEGKAGAAEENAEPCQVLAGVGVRSKSIIHVKSIKVYAFGVYVRPEKLRKHLGEKYAGVPPEELKLRDEFYDDLLNQELGLTVRLVVYYKGLSMEMVRSAFVTSLKNRLMKIKGTEEDEGLDTFSAYFSRPISIPRGTTIDFRWQPGGRLLTEIAGEQMEPIVSPHLCRAFFDMYIGDPPVSVKAKHQIGESFARMLSAC